MDSNPIVSVIMPVYNAINYVENAIQSVLDQTFSNFELIIIDDGATDGSGLLCDQFAAKDSRIKLIHQKNSGICNARNIGLKQAKGKYVSFCDHDDQYCTDYLMKSITVAEASNVSLVKFAYRSEYWRKEQLVHVSEESVPNKLLNVSELSTNYSLLNLTVRALWNGLYLRETIINNKINFNENIRAGMEDFLFNIMLLAHVRSIAYISDVLFVHFGRFGQSTSLQYSKTRLTDIISVQIEEARWLRLHEARQNVIVQHRSKYLSLFVETLIHTNCNLSMQEKKKMLHELKTSDQTSNKRTLLISFLEILTNPKVGILDTLYCLRMYGTIIRLWEIHSSLRNR